MRRGLRNAILALACAAAATPARGAEARTGPEPPQWYALPVVFWTPETRLGLGALGGVQFQAAAGARPSFAQASAITTLESQRAISALVELYPSPRTLVAAELRLMSYPESFWGIGPRARDEEEERYTARRAELLLAPERYVVPARLRAGPRLHLRRELVRDPAPGGRIAAGEVLGAAPFTTVGLGATATWDTRDGPFWPARGTLAQGWYLFHPGVAGAGDFGRGALDLRRFLPLGRRQVLALRAWVEGAHGAVPFTLLPQLGGAEVLRGYLRGRWRDRLSWSAQAEYRFPLRGRLAGVVFGGAGGVAPSAGELPRQPARLAGGAGARFRLTSAGVNVRADLAVGDEGTAFYLLTLEAF